MVVAMGVTVAKKLKIEHSLRTRSKKPMFDLENKYAGQNI